MLAEDLVAQNIDAVLNRRSCMAATLQIIEENIPEVQLLFLHEKAKWDISGWGLMRDEEPDLPLVYM